MVTAFAERALPFIVPGLIYGIGALGIALTYRFLKFPDFTALGSIMLGGIICIAIANKTNPFSAVAVACLGTGLLGVITGILICVFHVPDVLAGIVTYTATFSAGYLLTDGGDIRLIDGRYSILSPVFNTSDVFGLILLGLVLCGVFAFLIRTKIGGYVLAMTASKRFVQFRHRDSRIVLVALLGVGNMLIGFNLIPLPAGALFRWM